VTNSFDTSSLIELKNSYPEDIFPTIWKLLDTSMQQKDVLISEEVIVELATGTDGLDKRLKSKIECVIKTDTAIENEVKAIARSHPNLVDIKRQKSVGDPYVIAVAITYKCGVVTQESTKPGRVKIPHVCEHYKVPCCKLLEFMRAQNWRF
jgi:hypothetical protein